MAVQLNHHIVRVADKRVSAEYYAEVFGLAPPKPFGPFWCSIWPTACPWTSTTTTEPAPVNAHGPPGCEPGGP